MPECPIHHIEKLVQTGSYMKDIKDENGNIVDEEPMDVDYEYCPLCDQGSFDQLEEGPEAEILLSDKIKVFKEKNPDFIPHKGNLIEELMEFHEPTDADEIPRKAMAQFQIASNLMKAVSANQKGKILPNLGFWWSEPSGSNKTPLLVSGVDEFIDNVYSSHTRFETFTAKGMMKSLAKRYRDDPETKIYLLITWDEAQNILAMMKENAMADMLSFFCQLIDNRMQSYSTVARGDEIFPPITANLWISGVPEMIERASKSFWFQGAGNRFLFVKSGKVVIKDIGRPLEDHRNREHLIEELNLLHKITLVEYTDEFLSRYNEYRRKILADISIVQTDMSASQDIENFPVLSRIKYPVLVWKLSIIYAASRGNFMGELLRMDVEDLENAISDLEMYNRNAIEMFNYWLEKSTKDEEIKSSQRITHKFERHFHTLLRDKKNRWELTFIKEKIDTKEEIRYDANLSPEGLWIQDSLLQKYAKMTARSYRDAIETLEGQGYVIEHEARYKKDEKQSGYFASTFYKWKGN